MSHALIFITGGARSGKSAFAERLVRARGGRVAFVATARAGDDEMAQRIQKHQQRRPSAWSTFECEDDLADTISRASTAHDVILVDCLTVYLTRLLPHLADDEVADSEVAERVEERVEKELSEVLEAAKSSGRDVIIVSNEVGSGLVPPYPSGRLFRDMVGRANQMLASAADFAYLIVAGVALDLKALRATEFPWQVED